MKLKTLVLLFMTGLILYGIFFWADFGGNVCVIRAITGLPCPGCGMTRALLALTDLNISEAFRQHPLSLMMLPFGTVIIFSPFNKRLRTTVLNQRFWQVVIGTFLMVYFVRMLLMFPDLEPMTLKRDALLLRIVNFNWK